MVLRRNVHLAAAQLANGMVAAVVAVTESAGRSAGGAPDHLVAKADAEGRYGALSQIPGEVDGGVHSLGIARPVGEHNAVSVLVEHIVDPRFPGEGDDVRAVRRQRANDVVLDAAIYQGDSRPPERTNGLLRTGKRCARGVRCAGCRQPGSFLTAALPAAPVRAGAPPAQQDRSTHPGGPARRAACRAFSDGG